VKRTFAMVTILVSTGCQGGIQTPYSRTVAGYAQARSSLANPSNSDCDGMLTGRLSSKGGKLPIPEVPASGNFGGQFHYAAFSYGSSIDNTIVVSCDYNLYNIPVPEGYTPDWFGAWNVCDGGCTFTFQSSDAAMKIFSSTWVTKRRYYIYLYDVVSGNFIESYSIGSTKTKGSEGPYLKFVTPFANGLVYPYGDEIGLEIVHPSQ
jgi:hypothetical protein